MFGVKTWKSLSLIVYSPVFASYFWILREMIQKTKGAGEDIFGLQTGKEIDENLSFFIHFFSKYLGGPFWVTDLTLSDPYYVIPLTFAAINITKYLSNPSTEKLGTYFFYSFQIFLFFFVATRPSVNNFLCL